MADFEKIKSMDESTKLSVHGYIRLSQNLFPSNNPYYNLSQLITYLILLYFDEPECFEINNDQIFEYNGTEYEDFFRIYGKKKLERKYINTFKWKIETNETFEGRMGIMTGHQKVASYSIHCTNNVIECGSQEYGDSGSKWGAHDSDLSSFIPPNDILIISLDFTSNIISFESTKRELKIKRTLKDGVEIVRLVIEFRCAHNSIVKILS